MLLDYRERQRVSKDNLKEELASMGIDGVETAKVIIGIVKEKGEASISCYHFRLSSEELGTMIVFHDLGRGAISFGAITRWGQWDEMYEVLTLDETGEKFNFDGKPVYEGDDGACSLGNI